MICNNLLCDPFLIYPKWVAVRMAGIKWTAIVTDHSAPLSPNPRHGSMLRKTATAWAVTWPPCTARMFSVSKYNFKSLSQA